MKKSGTKATKKAKTVKNHHTAVERPTTGGSVLDYIDAHGLKRMDACWLLGINPWRFGKIITETEQSPVRSTSMAILLRMVLNWTELDPLPKYPRPRQLFDRVHALDPRISGRVFSMAVGCHPSWAGTRLDQADYSSPFVDRLLWWLDRRLDAATNKDEERKVVQEWLAMAQSEYRARGDTRLDFLDG